MSLSFPLLPRPSRFPFAIPPLPRPRIGPFFALSPVPVPQRSTDRRSPTRGLAHLTIECVTPELDYGRYPVKRIVGDVVHVGADVIRDGHDILAAQIILRSPGEPAWSVPMRHDENVDRWFGEFPVDAIGRWHFTIEAWTDVWETWRAGFQKKVEAGQDVRVELLEAAQLVRAAARRAKRGPARAALIQSSRAFEAVENPPDEAVLRRAVDAELAILMRENFLPGDLTRYGRELRIVVDRERAQFAAWYEFFRRATDPTGRHGTFTTAIAALPRIEERGFDVVYLPPIHPIGVTNRKGRNNTLTPGPGDVGSPWAIGGEDGGHTAVNAELGTLQEFEQLVARAGEHGLEIALDFAIQCSPDHPWLREHPEWFHRRPDGTLKYAENPPKKYQDIYNVNFAADDWRELWQALLDAVRFWVARGVKVFRVDNPHTKPIPFWEWLIAEVRSVEPDVVFLSEAFTAPAMMTTLAKVGFSQSYTYFTWKNTRWELKEFVEQLLEWRDFYRPNFFANTPDILHAYLQEGGRPAFEARLVLAATLGGSYGIYSGFENLENAPVREGSEEYLDSEKYEAKARALDGELLPLVRRLNEVRRANPALQRFANLTLLDR